MKTSLLLRTIFMAIWATGFVATTNAQELRGSFDEDVIEEAHHAQNERNLVCRDVGESCNPWTGKICCEDLVKCRNKQCTEVECTYKKGCEEDEICFRNKCKKSSKLQKYKKKEEEKSKGGPPSKKDSKKGKSKKEKSKKEKSKKKWFEVPAMFKKCEKNEVRIAGKCKKRGKTGDLCTPFVKPCDRANFCLPDAGVCIPRKTKPCLGKAWADIKQSRAGTVNSLKGILGKKLGVNATDAAAVKETLDALTLEDEDDVEDLAHLFCKKGIDPSIMNMLMDDFTKCLKKELKGEASSKEKEDGEPKEDFFEIMNLPMVIAVGVTGADGKISAGILKDVSGGEVGCYANACTGAALDGDSIELALGIHFVDSIEKVSGTYMEFGVGKIKRKGILGAFAGVSIDRKVSMMVTKGDGGKRKQYNMTAPAEDPVDSEAACYSHVAKRGSLEERMLHGQEQLDLIKPENNWELIEPEEVVFD